HRNERPPDRLQRRAGQGRAVHPADPAANRHGGSMSEQSNRRILLIDDTPSIHEDFRKILTPTPVPTVELDAMEAALFGSELKSTRALFELDSAYGGQEGLGKLKDALQVKHPYALA